MKNVSGTNNAHALEAAGENTSRAKAGYKNPGQNLSLRRDLLFLLIKIASIIGAFLLLFTFVFGITRYQEASMYPAIKDGDLVVFYRYSPEHYISQDVVAVKLEGQTQFRRVAAIAGDTVDITESGLVINGAPQQESGIIRKTERYVEGVSFPLVVPPGQVFVLGDNRADSIDSRIYGCVETEDILGKVMMIIRKRGI